MDVRKIFSDKLDRLPIGDHTTGLKAVRAHIETAIRHHARGQKEADSSAFTDSIYRCNQAFEGSVKEAYRVLSGKKPEKNTPAEIEKFLLEDNKLRSRVLDQLSRYRTAWRNPSTHDYMLDFDEDEALLAIVSVSVFAIVLCDQIESKIAFNNSEANTPPSGIEPSEVRGNLLELIARIVDEFFHKSGSVQDPSSSGLRQLYTQMEGSLAGYIAGEFSKIPEITVVQNASVGDHEVDILVSTNTENIAIELKVASPGPSTKLAYERANIQADMYLDLDGIDGLVVAIFNPRISEYATIAKPGKKLDRLRVLLPKKTFLEVGFP